MDVVVDNKISIRNVMNFINEGARSQKINHQEAQLLRSLMIIDYGKHIRRDNNYRYINEVKMTFLEDCSNISNPNIINPNSQNPEYKVPAENSLLSMSRTNILVRPTNAAHTKQNTKII